MQGSLRTILSRCNCVHQRYLQQSKTTGNKKPQKQLDLCGLWHAAIGMQGRKCYYDYDIVHCEIFLCSGFRFGFGLKDVCVYSSLTIA